MNKVYVVGIGPGGAEYMTEQARMALVDSDILCGYTVYVDLVKRLFPNKPTVVTPMRQELERCRLALEMAAGGRTVAMVCSGDAGIYGMASPILEMAADYPEVEIEVIAGVTAALSGAALLGAPLGNDFCVISLSDLLTPWPVIEKRLRSAAEGDFVICLYNPGSSRRTDHLKRACGILMDAGKSAQTRCGWARNIGRPGQESRVLTLEELQEEEADMFTTVFIGSSHTVFTGADAAETAERGCSGIADDGSNVPVGDCGAGMTENGRLGLADGSSAGTARLVTPRGYKSENNT